MNASIPRTAKSSSSAAAPSLLSGLTPPPAAIPPPGRQPAPHSRVQQPLPPPPQHQLQYQRQQHPGHGYSQSQSSALRNPLSANDVIRPPHSSSSKIDYFQTNTHTVLQPQPQPLAPLNDAQKKTLRHLDTLVEVVSKKVAEQMEQNKLSNMSFMDKSGSGMGNVNKRKRESQQPQQQGIDAFGSFLTHEANKFDFFDIEPTNNTILVSPLPNRGIPMFPEEFPPGVKERPLSWWGICEPSSDLLSFHEKKASELGFPIRKQGVPPLRKKETSSNDDDKREDEKLVEKKERASSRDDRSRRRATHRDDHPDKRESSEHRKRERRSGEHHGSRGRKESERSSSDGHRRKRDRSNSDSKRSRESSRHSRGRRSNGEEGHAERDIGSQRDESSRLSEKREKSQRSDSHSRDKSNRDKSDRREEDRGKSSRDERHRHDQSRKKSSRDKSDHQPAGRENSDPDRHADGNERSHHGEKNVSAENRVLRDERSVRNAPMEMRHHHYPDAHHERSFQHLDHRERPLGGRPIIHRYPEDLVGGRHNGERYHGERHSSERLQEARYHGERQPASVRDGGGQHPHPGGQYSGPPRPYGPQPGLNHFERRAIESRDMDIRRRYEGHYGDRYRRDGERQLPGDNRHRSDPYPDSAERREQLHNDRNLRR